MARPCVLAENLSFPTKYPPCYPLQANVDFLPPAHLEEGRNQPCTHWGSKLILADCR